MAQHIAFVGAGALGGFVGGLLADAGADVTLIDSWPQHVETMRASGLQLLGTHGERHVRVNAMHVGEVQSLFRNPVDIAFVTVKLYDARWATELVAPYLAREGLVVTMQNGLIETELAGIVGWQRLVGCVASRVQVEMLGPGRIRRLNPPGGAVYTSFRIGETHGRVTPRVRQLAELLGAVDSAKATTNLWGERWSKLVANAMTSPVSAVSGQTFKAMYQSAGSRALVIRLAAEAIAVGRSQGFDLEPVFGIPPQDYADAARGDAGALDRLEGTMRTWQATSLEGGISGMAQDLAKGRRTEVDYLCGEVVSRAATGGLAVPAQQAVTRLMHELERGICSPAPVHVDAILAATAVDSADRLVA